MKSFTVKHQSGLFYNRENGQRIVLKQHAEFQITGEDDSFEILDILNAPPPNLRESEEMCLFIQAKHNDAIKIFDAGQEFIFRVGLGKKRKEDQNHEYYFKCRILEDLFVYNRKKPRLAECQCEVFECITGLPNFEEIYATSLNKLASNTITHYFPKQRSASMNVITEFKPVFQITEKDLYGGYDVVKDGLAGIDAVIRKLFSKD